MNYKVLIKSRETRLKILNILGFVPDSIMLRIQYRMKFGKWLNLNNPKTFNEKLQWLKLNNRKEIHAQMVDKIAVRKIIENRIGGEYLVPLLGKWRSYDEIDFSGLPDQFVMKCSHDSGSVRIIRNKSEINHEDMRVFFQQRLKNDAYIAGREWPYKNASRYIFAEEFLIDKEHDVINVYKIFTFNGEPKIFQVIMNDKHPDETVDYYDTDWNRLNMIQTYPNSKTGVAKPENLEAMIELARNLTTGEPFLRVDLYEVEGKLYFSEYTFFTDSGYSRFEPEEWDTILGEWVDISGY